MATVSLAPARYQRAVGRTGVIISSAAGSAGAAALLAAAGGRWLTLVAATVLGGLLNGAFIGFTEVPPATIASAAPGRAALRGVGWLLGVQVCLVGFEADLPTWLPSFLDDETALPRDAAVTLSSTVFAAMLAGRLLTSRLAHRHRADRLLAGALLLVLAGVPAMAAAGNPVTAVVGAVVAGIGTGAFAPLMAALILALAALLVLPLGALLALRR